MSQTRACRLGGGNRSRAGGRAGPQTVVFSDSQEYRLPLSDKAFRKVEGSRQREVSWVLAMKGGGHRGQTNDVKGTTFPADSALAHKEQ